MRELAAAVHARGLDQVARDRPTPMYWRIRKMPSAPAAPGTYSARCWSIQPSSVHDHEGRDHVDEAGQQHRRHHQREQRLLEAELHAARTRSRPASRTAGSAPWSSSATYRLQPRLRQNGRRSVSSCRLAARCVAEPHRRRQVEDLAARVRGEHEHEPERRQHQQRADADDQAGVQRVARARRRRAERAVSARRSSPCPFACRTAAFVAPGERRDRRTNSSHDIALTPCRSRRRRTPSRYMYIAVVIAACCGPPLPPVRMNGSSNSCRSPMSVSVTREEHHRLEQRQRDVEELLPAARAVQRGGLVEVAGDGLHRRQVQHRVPADVAPEHDERDRGLDAARRRAASRCGDMPNSCASAALIMPKSCENSA